MWDIWEEPDFASNVMQCIHIEAPILGCSPFCRAMLMAVVGMMAGEGEDRFYQGAKHFGPVERPRHRLQPWRCI